MTRSRKRRMSGIEIAEAVAEFDDELVALTFRQPSADAKARWQRARRKRGRPREGEGAKVISVSVERGLLKASDKLATRMEITRAELIARGLRAVLVAEGRRAP